jgi:Zn-dependent protease
VQALDLDAFLFKISIYAIPLLFAVTLHEVAHGWTARFFGDRTADMLGRLSLNPLRHIDPVGTLLVPGLLLAMSLPVFGWARPVPVALNALRKPRLAAILVAAAGPAANFVMALIWCGVLAVLLRVQGALTMRDEEALTLNSWVVLMAQAGIVANVVLGLFNLLPIPPLDGGRVLAGLLPVRLGAGLEKVEPVGIVIVIGLSVTHVIGWLFNPAYRAMGHVINAIWVGPAA